MFSKVAILATLSLALSVAAAPSDTEYECTTGQAQCCNQLEQSQTAAASKILAIVGLTAQGLTGQVGQNCSPVTVIGVASGASCTHQPVCCEDIKQNGLVAVGCTPANVVL